jgi:hypothetical protein
LHYETNKEYFSRTHVNPLIYINRQPCNTMP